MKTRILVVILCLACVASFAQNKPKRGRGGKANKPKQQTQLPNTLNNPGQSAKPLANTPDTTTKRPVVVAKPTKPFDRPLDGYYKKTNIISAKVTPYPALREVDVAYIKRIWRDIDTREKMNQYLNSPKQRLIDVLLNAINSGELTAYDANPDPKIDPDGDAFSRPLTAESAYRTLADSSLIEKRDANGNVIKSQMAAGDFNRDSLVKFRIKEDWIFDKQRSMFEPRIIGLAPMVRIKGVANADYQPAFWIYFPDARQILATKEVASRDNDNTGLSFDDVFMKRIFTSYIVKESNDKNDRIRDYEVGLDRLYESDRIKKALMDWEINLWQY